MRQILDIWASGHGVVSLHCFQHVIAVEAYTREACLVDALGECLACGMGFIGGYLIYQFSHAFPLRAVCSVNNY